MHTRFTYSTHAVEIVQRGNSLWVIICVFIARVLFCIRCPLLIFQMSYLGFKEKGLQKRAITDIYPNTRYKHIVRSTKTNYHFVMKIAKHCYKQLK